MNWIFPIEDQACLHLFRERESFVGDLATFIYLFDK